MQKEVTFLAWKITVKFGSGENTPGMHEGMAVGTLGDLAAGTGDEQGSLQLWGLQEPQTMQGKAPA